MKLLASIFLLVESCGYTINAQTSTPYSRVQTIVINVSPRGFDRSAITIPPGRYFIEVRDQRRRASLGLEFTNSSGQSVFTRASAAKVSHVQFVHLPEGAFTLRARENPAWMVVINAKN